MAAQWWPHPGSSTSIYSPQFLGQVLAALKEGLNKKSTAVRDTGVLAASFSACIQSVQPVPCRVLSQLCPTPAEVSSAHWTTPQCCTTGILMHHRLRIPFQNTSLLYGKRYWRPSGLRVYQLNQVNTTPHPFLNPVILQLSMPSFHWVLFGSLPHTLSSLSITD